MASEGTGKRKNCDKWKMGRRVACCRVHRGIVEADKEWQNPDWVYSHQLENKHAFVSVSQGGLEKDQEKKKFY